MTDFLLIVHILSASAWIGGSLMAGFVGPRIARIGGEATLGWARVAAEAGAKFFNPAGILTALSGIGLVLVSDIYGWSDTFVSIGLGVVVAGALIGALVYRPGSTRLIAALESKDFPAAAAQGKNTAIWGALMAGLLIVAVVVMVLKTGSG